MEEPTQFTDFALELAEAFNELKHPANEIGATHLASKFEVAPWSPEFMLILVSIRERIIALQTYASTAPAPDLVRSTILGGLSTATEAIGINSLNRPWKEIGSPSMASCVGNIALFSPTVQQVIKYPKPTPDEIKSVIAEADNLLEYLALLQLTDGDFCRQATIEGIRMFRFRLAYLKWLGANYSRVGLQSVAGAGLALATFNGQSATNSNNAEAVQRVIGFVKRSYETLHTTKEVTETADFLVKAFAAGGPATYLTSKALSLLAQVHLLQLPPPG